MNEAQVRERIDRQIDDEERLKYAAFSYSSADATFEENKVKIAGRLASLKF